MVKITLAIAFILSASFLLLSWQEKEGAIIFVKGWSANEIRLHNEFVDSVEAKYSGYIYTLPVGTSKITIDLDKVPYTIVIEKKYTYITRSFWTGRERITIKQEDSLRHGGI
jgi:hypothetical protein